jgi:hypothetical protein
MNITMLEVEELKEMKATVRRNIEALEVCLDCNCVSECEQIAVDDGAPIWLCRKCAVRLLNDRATTYLASRF